VSPSSALVAFVQASVGNNSPARGLDDADHDANALVFFVDPVNQNLAYLGIRREQGICGGLGHSKG
jgi:hypothetical protein